MGKTLAMCTTTAAVRLVEDQLNDLVIQKAQVTEEQKQKNLEQIDVQMVINKVTYYLEHLEETLLRQTDPIKQEVLFSMVFDQPPTYADLKFGTAKIACVFKLNDAWKNAIGQKYNLGEPAGIRTRNQWIKSPLLYR